MAVTVKVQRRYRVTGRVQGVFFRASTRHEAERLGIAGRAVNLPDGSVEVVAQGPADRLDLLEAWLHVGPPGARVDRVERRDEPVSDDLEGFTTG
ncbi:MAG: acylphosphatase [Deltaproteobacteria bacterium]|nr:acylphosphatase [Deltaproteobacteria bacterium]